jgi:hypothetical protein
VRAFDLSVIGAGRCTGRCAIAALARAVGDQLLASLVGRGESNTRFELVSAGVARGTLRSAEMPIIRQPSNGERTLGGGAEACVARSLERCLGTH